MNEHFEQTGEKPGAERPEWAEWWNVVRSNVAKNKQTIQVRILICLLLAHFASEVQVCILESSIFCFCILRKWPTT